jgi:hypothetical protein
MTQREDLLYSLAVFALVCFATGLVASSCTAFQSEAEKHAKAIELEQRTFDRQKWERRYKPAVEETEAFFSFTNRLSQRDKDPMDLADLGRLMVQVYGTNIAWQLVCTAYADYSNGAALSNVSNLFWLLDQPPRVRDTAWMINFRKEWLP